MVAHKDCLQRDRILTLELEKTQMSKDIQEIKETWKDTQEMVLQLKETMEAFMLTSPQKFANKEEFRNFKESINLKIAYVSGAWVVIISLISFFGNKYF